MENRIYAERLLALRKKSGLSARDFAEHFGITYCTYSQWESGRREPAPHIVSMIERIIELEDVLKDRIKLEKRIETIEHYQKVLKEAGMHEPNDQDAAKMESLGQLETIQKGNITYYLFKDDRGYQVCYEPSYDKFIEKEQIEALLT